MTSKPRIWVKGYPYVKEVKALADLGKQGAGMEIFLSDENAKSNNECIDICKAEYPVWGAELFVYLGEVKRKPSIIYDPASPDRKIRELSRSYLFSSLELAAGQGAQHLQLDGNDGYRGKPGEDINAKKSRIIEERKQLLEEIAKRFPNIKVLFENTIPIDDCSSELVFSCAGHNLSDFSRFGLPLEYDLNHHAIALDVYSRAEEFGFHLNEEEKELADSVRKLGITATILKQLGRQEDIYFVHFCNATPFSLGKKTGAEEEGLLDLEEIVPVLVSKSQNITPEVGDDDFIARPNLRGWVKRLQNLVR